MSIEYTFKVLSESEQRPDHKWVHSCGAKLMGKTAHLTVRDGLFPLSGNGDVESTVVPYCPTCEEPPRSHGFIQPDGTVDHPSFIRAVA